MRKAATEEEAAARIQEKGKENALSSKNFGLEHWIVDSRDFLNFWMNSMAWMRSKGQV